MKTENKKISSFTEHLDAQYGKIGTETVKNTKKSTRYLNMVFVARNAKRTWNDTRTSGIKMWNNKIVYI
ncbi:hypothetical protein [Flavobacterium sp. ZS1P14]|uniref:hypothetical protein n=1 Tax=Flavobacterium sp. ZS1P14 TaxID=3401729 RepID=UPI003AAC9001